MSNRVYIKNDYLYATDQKGELCEIYTKQIKVPAAIAAGTLQVIQLLRPGSPTHVKTFTIHILLEHGGNLIHYSCPVGNAATQYTLLRADNTLTINIPVGGTPITVNSVITITYTVGA